MPLDVDRYRTQLTKNPARGRVLRLVEEILEEEGNHKLLAELLGERLDALEMVAARPNIVDKVEERYCAALRHHAIEGTESIESARSALRLAARASKRGDPEARKEAALWALVRGVSDDTVRAKALEHAGGGEAARGLAKDALSQDAFKDRKGALRHVMSRLSEEAGDLDSAFFEALRAARTAPPMRRYLDEAFRLALSTTRFEETALVFADAAADEEAIDPALRSYLRMKLAHILANHLDRGPEALEIYSDILAHDPDNAGALKRAGKLAGKLGVDFKPPEPAPPAPPPPPEPAAEVAEAAVDADAAIDIEPSLDAHPPEPAPATIDAAAIGAPPEAEVAVSASTDLTTGDFQEVANLPLPSEAGDVFASLSDAEIDPRADQDSDSPDVFAAPGGEAAQAAEAEDVFASSEEQAAGLDEPFEIASDLVEAGMREAERRAAEPEAREPITAPAHAPVSDRPEPTTAPAHVPVGLEAELGKVELDSVDERDAGAAPPIGGEMASALEQDLSVYATPDTEATEDMIIQPSAPADAAAVAEAFVDTGAEVEAAPGAWSDADAEIDDGGFDPELQTQEVGEAQIIEEFEEPELPAIDAEGLERDGKFEELAQGLLDRLGQRPTVEALMRLADIYESRLSSPERAFPMFARALETGDDEHALAGLLRCAPSAPDAAAALCDNLLERRGAKDDAVASLARIVAAAEIKSGALDSAADRLAAVFAKRSNDEGLFGQLDRLYQKTGQPGKRAELRSRANFGDASRRFALLGERVDLLEMAGDLRAALRTAHSLQAAKPRDEEVAHRVVGLAEKTGDVDAIKDALIKLVGLEQGEEGLATARRLADLADQSGDLAAARAAWRDVLRRRPGDANALRALSDLLEGDEALHDELAEVLELRLTIARNVQDEPLQLMVLHRLADLHAARNLPEAEEEALRKALQVDPEDGSALELVAERMRSRGALEELAALYDELGTARDNPSSQIAMWLEAAKVQRHELGRRAAARSVLEKALDVEPSNVGILANLAELCHELGDSEAAASYLERATVQEAGSGQATHLYQLGQLYERGLRKVDEALDAYRRALETNPDHADSNTALKRLFRSAGRWSDLIELLEQHAQRFSSAEAAGNALVEAANILLEQAEVRDPAHAERLLGEAIRRAPQLIAAREQLVDLMVAREDFGAARTHLDQLEAQHGAEAMSLDHLIALAKACSLRSEPDLAQGHLRRVLKRAPSHLAALRALGDLLVVDGDADAEETIAVLEQRILHHGPSLDDAESASVHGQIGILRRGLGDTAGARKALHRALALMDLDAPDIDVLAAHAELLADEGAVDDAMTELMRLAQLLDGPQAAARWMQLGNVAENRAQDFERAADAYAQACRLDPDRLDAFEGQLRVEIARGDTGGALQAAEALLERELNPQRLSRLEMAVAAICRSSLGDIRRAAAYLKRAVEHDPENRDAREAAAQLFEELEDYPSLNAILTEALDQIPPENSDERVTLLETIAQIRRYELRDLKGAIAALEQILAVDRDHTKAREDLGRLYTELGRDEEALRTWRDVLQRNPVAGEAYRAMLAILRRRRSYDAAYCVAATMVALEQADDEVRGIVKQLRAPFPRWPKVPSDPSRVLEPLVHARARGPVREILALATPVLWPHFAHNLKDYDLRRRDLLSANEIPNSVANAVRQAARVLDVPEPDLYRGGPDVVGISLLPIEPVSIMVGRDVIRGGMTPERAFAFGRAVAYLRPESLLAAALPATELRGIAEAALLRAMPQVQMDATTREIARLGDMIERRLPPQAADRLVDLGRDYYRLRSSYAMQDLVAAISYTSDRVGFLFAGELAPAVSSIKAAAGREHVHSARLAIKELVLFSVSNEYFSLRRELGLTLRQSDTERVLKL